ncbi:MAG: hypothetical protein M0Z84_15330 [Gammaproteobacteria bacterium]|nr:hypothetical protein [Gammaproteobacteria bacterium]
MSLRLSMKSVKSRTNGRSGFLWMPLLVPILGGALLMQVPTDAFASTVTFNFGALISGPKSPAGALPWMQATFVDNGSGGGVTLTLMAYGLTGSENLSAVDFNIDPVLERQLRRLRFAYAGGTGTAARPSASKNRFKVPGDGSYDIRFVFPKNGGFNAGDSVSYRITGITGLTAASFNFPSLCTTGCGTGSNYAAAQVQNIPGSTTASAWIGSKVGVVPIPAAGWLFGWGFLGLIGIARRRRRPL